MAKVGQRGGVHEQVSGWERLSLEERERLERVLAEPEPDWDEDATERLPGVPFDAGRVAERLGMDALEADDAGGLIALAKAVSGVSQRELAARVGVSNPRVAQVQRSGQAIEVHTLQRYAEAMGYDLELRLVPRDGGPVLSAKTQK